MKFHYKAQNEQGAITEGEMELIKRQQNMNVPVQQTTEFKYGHIERTTGRPNVKITPGVTIGEGAVIGMGTVVGKDVPPLAIIAGQSYRILKYRDRKHYEKLCKEGKFAGKEGKAVY